MKTKTINAKPLKRPSVFLVVDQNNAPGRVMGVFNNEEDALKWRDDYCSLEEHTLWHGQPDFKCECE